MGLIIFRFWY